MTQAIQTTSRSIYTLAEAVRRVGRSESTILRAELDGRIAPARRDELGHRMFNDNDVERLRLLLGR
jgi:DNA-binding transcriptional MerR regulator